MIVEKTLIGNEIALFRVRGIKRGDARIVKRLSEYLFVFLKRLVDLLAIADKAYVDIGVCAVEQKQIASVEKRIRNNVAVIVVAEKTGKSYAKLLTVGAGYGKLALAARTFESEQLC